MSGIGRAKQQDVLASENCCKGTVDDVLALGKAGGEVGAELLDGVGLLDLGHGNSIRATGAER